MCSPCGKATTPGGRSQRPVHLGTAFSLTSPPPPTHPTDRYMHSTRTTHTHPTRRYAHTTDRHKHTHTHVHTVTQTQPILAHTCMRVHTREHMQVTPAHMHVFTHMHPHPHACTHGVRVAHTCTHGHIHTSTAHTHTSPHVHSHVLAHHGARFARPQGRALATVPPGLTAARKRCTRGLRVCRCFFPINLPVV